MNSGVSAADTAFSIAPSLRQPRRSRQGVTSTFYSNKIRSGAQAENCRINGMALAFFGLNVGMVKRKPLAAVNRNFIPCFIEICRRRRLRT